MNNSKKWLVFEINQDGLWVKEFFEKVFCKEFFSIQNNIPEAEIILPEGFRWIECRPINWLSYQSKYTHSITGIEDSLNKIYNNHKSYYPDLKKVYFYLKVFPPSLSRLENDPNGIIKKLEAIGVKIQFFGDFGHFEAIYTEEKYKDLRKYFELKSDISSELQLFKKYVENLYLREAKELLEVIESKENSIKDGLKFEYYRWRWNFKSSYNKYLEDNFYTASEDDFFKACEFQKDTSDWKLVLAVWYMRKENYSEAEKILKELLQAGSLNIKAYSNLLILKCAQKVPFDDILADIEEKYLREPKIKKIIGVVAFNSGKLKLAKEYYEAGYSTDSDNKITDLIDYIQILTDYCYEEFWIVNLDLNGKQEYVKIMSLYEENKHLLDGKNLQIFLSIFNVLGIISVEVMWEKYEAVCFLKKALAIKKDAVVLFNLAKIYKDNKENDKSKAILEELYTNISKYISNPNIQQTPLLLSQIYLEEWMSKTEVYNFLTTFRNNYKDDLLPFVRKWINIVIFNLLNDAWSKDELKTFTDLIISENPKEFIYHCFKFTMEGDTKWLLQAYEIAKEPTDDFSSNLIQLAYQLSENWFQKESFDLYKKYLRDLSDSTYTEDFISLWIKLRETEIVEATLENYKGHLKGKENELYIGYKAFLFQRKWDYRKALQIIDTFIHHENFNKLLLHKAHLHIYLDELAPVKKIIDKILASWKLQDFRVGEKSDFIRLYTSIDKQEALRLLYKILQESNINIGDEPKELVQLYMWLFFECKTERTMVDLIDQNSIVVIKELGIWTEYKILIDGYSAKINADKLWAPDSEGARLLLGKSRWEKITNIFWKPLLHDREYEIISIQNKVEYYFDNYIYKRVMDYWIMQTVAINMDDPLSSFQGLLEKKVENWKHKEAVLEDLYKKLTLVPSVLQEFYWIDYLEVFELVTRWDKFNFISDVFQKIDTGRQSITPDLTAILSIFALGLQDLIKLKFDIVIPQSTLDYFNHRIAEMEQKSFQASWFIEMTKTNDVAYREHTKSSADEKVALLHNIADWLKTNAEVKSGKKLLDRGEIWDIIGFEFVDSMQIVQENNLWFYSDEIGLRRLARGTDYRIKAFWSESLMNSLFEDNLIDKTTLQSLGEKLVELKFKNLGS